MSKRKTEERGQMTEDGETRNPKHEILNNIKIRMFK